MPIIDQYPSKPPKVKDTPIDVSQENDSAVVDTDRQRLDNLLTHVEGMSWVVTYYQQVLGQHDHTLAQEVTLDPTQQQYNKVEHLELKVQSPLEVSTNDETYAQTLRGTAVVYSGTLIPNKGDVFLADIGAGELGVFTLTEVELLSHYKDRCYEVSYRMTRRIDSPTDTYLTDLGLKVVGEFTYLKDYLQHGKDPIVTPAEATLGSRLQGQMDVLLSQYFNLFYMDEHATFMMPDKARVTYDPMIPKAILSLFNVNEHPLLRRLRTPNVEAIEALQQITVWDCLLKRTPELLPTVPHRAQLHPVGLYGNHPQLYNIAYSGLDYVVVPEQKFQMSTEHNLHKVVYTHEYLPEIETRYKDLNRDLAVKRGDDELPDTPNVRSLATYLFTDGVYRSSEVHSKLESLVVSYFRRSGVDREMLVKLSENALKWSYLESYYYIPVLMILITASLRGA